MARNEPHIVIVGAGFGGLRAAQAMRSVRARITLVDKSNHHLFQPLLYQVAVAGLSPADIAVPIRYVFRKQKNVEVLMTEVEGLDLHERKVFTKGPTLSFDHLVLAIGSGYNYFGHPEWELLAPSLKSINDATRIRRDLLCAFELAEVEEDSQRRQQLLTFAVIGGGPTGVETAGALAELARRALASDFRRINPSDARIILFEAGPRILPMFPPNLSQKAAVALKRLGVEIRINSPVDAIGSNHLSSLGETILTSVNIWAAGVMTRHIGSWLGAETDSAGRVIVEPDLSLPGHPHVFVIGDAAHVRGVDGLPLPALAPVAMQEGSYVAKVIRAHVEDRSKPGPFRYKDRGTLATVGRSFAIAVLGPFQLAGFMAWLAWTVVHIFYLIDFQNRVLVMIQWIWAYLTYHRGARLIVPREEFSPPHED